MDKILKQLVKDNSQVYSKIVTFLEHEHTGRTDYNITVNGNTITVVDAQPLDGGSVIKGVFLSTNTKNYSIPVIGSSGIVIFVNKHDAYVVQLADKAYVRSEVTNANGTSSIQEVTVENGKSVVNMSANEMNFKTTNGGEFNFINDNVIISNVSRIRLQVTADNGNVQQEIILDKDKGISVISYTGTPISIKNNSGSLKDVLEQLIDAFNSATYVSPAGVATVNPLSIAKLNSFKPKIEALLK